VELFSIVEDAHVILLAKGGIYRQADVYSRGNKFYAKVAGGYARLIRHGSTSMPVVKWIDHEGFEAP